MALDQDSGDSRTWSDFMGLDQNCSASLVSSSLSIPASSSCDHGMPFPMMGNWGLIPFAPSNAYVPGQWQHVFTVIHNFSRRWLYTKIEQVATGDEHYEINFKIPPGIMDIILPWGGYYAWGSDLISPSISVNSGFTASDSLIGAAHIGITGGQPG
jgi:hypothetical protein